MSEIIQLLPDEAYASPNLSNESTVQLEAKELQPYRELVGAAVELVKVWPFGKDVSQIQGQIFGKDFTVRIPHLREGKHARVAIVEVTDGDREEFSCVLRNDPESSEKYLQVIQEKPFVATLVPKLYGVMGDWVVMEKLSGLELQELTDKLASDPSFLKKYARTAYQVIKETSEAGLRLRDVEFGGAHNTIVDPESAEIRIVEQDTIDLYKKRPSNQLVTGQVLKELSQTVKHKDRSKEFVFELVKLASKDIGDEQLYYQATEIGPDHPDYMKTYFTVNHKYPEEGYKVPVTYGSYDSSGMTIAISPDLVESVKNDQLDRFKEIMDAGHYKISIRDKNDSRSAAILLPSK